MMGGRERGGGAGDSLCISQVCAAAPLIAPPLMFNVQNQEDPGGGKKEEKLRKAKLKKRPAIKEELGVVLN